MLQSVRWEVTWPNGHAGYELVSSSSKALQRAREMFHPFLAECSGEPRCRWSIDADGDLWTPHLLTGELPPLDEAFTYTENLRTLDRALTTVEFASIWNLVYAHPHPISTHAALLEKDASGVLILGPKYAGKSTLACALWRSGWNLLTDDVALIDPQTTWCGATPRRVSLRHGSRELLGEELWEKVLSSPSCSEGKEGYLFAPADISHQRINTDLKLRAIIFLARSNEPFTNGVSNAENYMQMHSATLLTSLFPYTNLTRTRGAGAALAILTPLANQVPAFDVARQPPARMVETMNEILRKVI